MRNRSRYQRKSASSHDEKSATEVLDKERLTLPELGVTHESAVLPAVRSLIRAVDAYSRQLSTILQLTWPQWLCLQALREVPGVTGVVLARRVNLGESTLVGVLDRLVAKGLVTRERSVSDRRRQVLRLTADGEARVDRWQTPLGDSLEQALSDLPQEQRDELVRSLTSLTRIFTAALPRNDGNGNGSGMLDH